MSAPDHDRPEGLPSFVEPGLSFRLDFGEGNPNNYRSHIRGFVDGDVIMRRWQQRKRCWHYEVVPPWWFELYGKHICKIAKSKEED